MLRYIYLYGLLNNENSFRDEMISKIKVSIIVFCLLFFF